MWLLVLMFRRLLNKVCTRQCGMTHNRHLLGDALPGFLMCLRVARLPCAGGCRNDMLIGLSISGEFDGSGTSLQVDVSGIEWRPGGPA